MDYNILEKKLQAGGFYGHFNQLLMSYLTDSTQYVEINGEKSSLRSMKIGVPQGSLLGPRLFALYVNDLPSTPSIGQIHMYADDTTAFVVSKSVDEATNFLNILANDIQEWCKANKLTIHSEKTEFLIMTPRPFHGPINSISINGVNVKSATESKSLGITVDNRLTWTKQIKSVQKSFCSKLSLIRRISFLPADVLEEIYFKTVIPAVTYGMLIWATCPENRINCLEELHARAARIIHRIPRGTNTQDSLNKANWKPLKYLYNRRLASFMFDIYKNNTDPRLLNLFKTRRSKRSTSNFEVIRPLKEIDRDTLAFRGPALWNALPDGVKLSASKEIFKNNIKNGRTINRISFSKGTVFNTNKKEDFIYH